MLYTVYTERLICSRRGALSLRFDPVAIGELMRSLSLSLSVARSRVVVCT